MLQSATPITSFPLPLQCLLAAQHTLLIVCTTVVAFFMAPCLDRSITS